MGKMANATNTYDDRRTRIYINRDEQHGDVKRIAKDLLPTTFLPLAAFCRRSLRRLRQKGSFRILELILDLFDLIGVRSTDFIRDIVTLQQPLQKALLQIHDLLQPYHLPLRKGRLVVFRRRCRRRRRLRTRSSRPGTSTASRTYKPVNISQNELSPIKG